MIIKRIQKLSKSKKHILNKEKTGYFHLILLLKYAQYKSFKTLPRNTLNYPKMVVFFFKGKEHKEAARTHNR